MFSAKKLEKLVTAGIISPAQKAEILKFEETSNTGFVIKALSLLAVFTIGIGIISLIASNWDKISNGVKITIMFALLLITAASAVYNQQKNLCEKAEKLLAMLFFLIGASIGLVIQIYQLNGDNFYTPIGFWCLITVPLLFAAKKQYVAYFWVPLFLFWCLIYFLETKDFFFWMAFESLLSVYAALAVLGMVLSRSVPSFPTAKVLQKNAFAFFYTILALYMFTDSLSNLIIAALILILTSLFYRHIKDYQKLNLNIKFAGLEVFCLYLYLGDKIGLFHTGIGMIIGGVILILLLKGITRVSKQLKGERKDAKKI